jgi:ABC-2 type transport system ATP-binding protein
MQMKPMRTRTGAAGDRAQESLDVAIRVQGLRMNYGSVEAVRGIDLDVKRGEVFAILGPNGAGKTTTVEVLEGFRRPTGGNVRVLDQDPATAGGAWRARIGAVLQESQPEAELKVRECLALYAGYYPAPLPVTRMLELVGLVEERDRLCKALSGGQKRRLDLAVALIGDPELLFLDEPTTGFDPSARRAAWETIAGLRFLGKTIVLTTHYMEEAEYLADRIAVISGGLIVAQGTPASLGGRDGAATTITFSLPSDVTLADLPPALEGSASEIRGDRVEIRTCRPTASLYALTNWALERRLELANLQVSRPSLEDIYLQLTNGGTQ